tara:strand:- start:1070 stop:1294 length:225 start_codon:yes stop_codon:yes gene_type:complete
MKLDFSVKVRKAAKEASDNGRCWWVESHILNSYLWRGPIKDLVKDRKIREHKNEQTAEQKESNLQPVDELCELS